MENPVLYRWTSRIFRRSRALHAPILRHRTLVVAGLLVLVIWLLAVGRWFLTDALVPWDSKNQFYASFRFLALTLNAGTLPFWNPYHYGGHPSVADPQSMIFAPLFFAWAWFDATPSLRVFDLLVYAHLLIGGLSITAIGARARWPAAASVLAATLFMFGGAAAGRLQHTGIIVSYSMFPLALLLLQLALARRSYALALAFAFVAAVVALGRNQVALLLCFVLAGAAVAEVSAADRPLSYLRERAAVLGAMVSAGFGLIATPLLLTMQFAALSNRPQLPLVEVLLGSLHPSNLAQLAVANIFGAHGPQYWGPGGITEPLLAFTDDSFNYGFVGVVPLVLLLWLGIAGGYALRRGRIFFAIVAVLALAYALGRYTPLFALAFDHVPGVKLFRRPVDGTFVFLTALALLSGALLSDYVREGLPRIPWLVALVISAAVVAILAAGVTFAARQNHTGDAIIAILQTLPVSVAVMLMLWLARTPRRRMTAAALVASLGVADVLWWNTAFRLNADVHGTYAVLERSTPARHTALAVLENALSERHRAGERPRVEIMGLGGAWQNLAMVRGIEAINGYNPLRIGFYDRLVAPGEASWINSLRAFPASFSCYDSVLARALGLEFVVLGSPIEMVPHLLRRPVADVLQAGPDMWIYRLRNPSPRLTFMRSVQIVDTDMIGIYGQLLEPPSSDRILIHEGTPPLRSYDAVLAASAGSARIVRWRPDRVEIEVDSLMGGMLALHDIWYPGWVAEIDGTRAPILRANVLFRSVEVPPGPRQVVFRYAPFSLENLYDALQIAMRR